MVVRFDVIQNAISQLCLKSSLEERHDIPHIRQRLLALTARATSSSGVAGVIINDTFVAPNHKGQCIDPGLLGGLPDERLIDEWHRLRRWQEPCPITRHWENCLSYSLSQNSKPLAILKTLEGSSTATSKCRHTCAPPPEQQQSLTCFLPSSRLPKRPPRLRTFVAQFQV